MGEESRSECVNVSIKTIRLNPTIIMTKLF